MEVNIWFSKKYFQTHAFQGHSPPRAQLGITLLLKSEDIREEGDPQTVMDMLLELLQWVVVVVYELHQYGEEDFLTPLRFKKVLGQGKVSHFFFIFHGTMNPSKLIYILHDNCKCSKPDVIF